MEALDARMALEARGPVAVAGSGANHKVPPTTARKSDVKARSANRSAVIEEALRAF
jgi:hypothetical protein